MDKCFSFFSQLASPEMFCIQPPRKPRRSQQPLPRSCGQPRNSSLYWFCILLCFTLVPCTYSLDHIPQKRICTQTSTIKETQAKTKSSDIIFYQMELAIVSTLPSPIPLFTVFGKWLRGLHLSLLWMWWLLVRLVPHGCLCFSPSRTQSELGSQHLATGQSLWPCAFVYY